MNSSDFSAPTALAPFALAASWRFDGADRRAGLRAASAAAPCSRSLPAGQSPRERRFARAGVAAPVPVGADADADHLRRRRRVCLEAPERARSARPRPSPATARRRPRSPSASLLRWPPASPAGGGRGGGLGGAAAGAEALAPAGRRAGRCSSARSARRTPGSSAGPCQRRAAAGAVARQRRRACDVLAIDSVDRVADLRRCCGPAAQAATPDVRLGGYALLRRVLAQPRPLRDDFVKRARLGRMRDARSRGLSAGERLRRGRACCDRTGTKRSRNTRTPGRPRRMRRLEVKRDRLAPVSSAPLYDLARGAAAVLAGPRRPRAHPAPAAPIVNTCRRHARERPSAVAPGHINPRTLATTYYFQYGPTATYGSQTPTLPPAGDDTVKVCQPVTGLLPGYHYRLVATNAEGKRRGHDRIFRRVKQEARVRAAQDLQGDPAGQAVHPQRHAHRDGRRATGRSCSRRARIRTRRPTPTWACRSSPTPPAASPSAWPSSR